MTIFELLDYDAWASARLLDAVETLSPEQFVHEFGGSLSSVRQQFAHLISVADRYRARMAQGPVPDVPPESFKVPGELRAYEAQMRRSLQEFVAGLTREELGQELEHQTRRGAFRATVEQTLHHMVNHATYHRGQVAALLKLHGVDFPDIDIIFWLNPSPSVVSPAAP